jgi:hypothetical protein
MTLLRATRWFAVLCVASISTAAVAADEPPSSAQTREATERMERGLHLLANHDPKGALVEFERVQELVPSPQVLYHTARTYAAMHKPVEAVDTLDDLLKNPGSLKPALVAKAKAAKEEEERKIGKLAVGVNVPAAIEVDGEHEGDAPLEAPVAVAAGDHFVCVLAAGMIPACQPVTVAAKGSAEMIFELQPTEAKPAHVAVVAALPGGEVYLDDTPVARTPFSGKLHMLPGKHTIEIRRPGYMIVRHELNLVPGQNTAVAYDPDEDPSGGVAHGELRLKVEPDGVKIAVDGRERGVYQGPIDLPAGPHVVKMEKTGFEGLDQDVDVTAGGEGVVKGELRPTAKTRATYVSGAQARRSWALVSTVGGVLVTGAGVGLAVWSNGKLPGARNGVALAQKDAQPGGACDPASGLSSTRLLVCQQQLSSAQSEVDKYTNLRTVGIGGAVVGAAVIGLGVYLLVTGGDPDRYDSDETLAGSLRPVFVATPDGAGLWLRGKF